MKKQKNQLIVLIVLLVVCVAGYFGLKLYQDKQAEKEEQQQAEEDAGIAVASIDASSITSFSYLLDGETLSFTKNDDEWTCDSEPETDLDEDMITSLLSNVTSVTADQALEDVDEDSLGDYGLSDPFNVITIGTSSDEGETQTYTFLVGDYNATMYCYYFMLEGDSNVYTMQSGLCSAFSDTVDDLKATEEESEDADTEETSETDDTEVSETVEDDTADTSEAEDDDAETDTSETEEDGAEEDAGEADE